MNKGVRASLSVYREYTTLPQIGQCSNHFKGKPFLNTMHKKCSVLQLNICKNVTYCDILYLLLLLFTSLSFFMCLSAVTVLFPSIQCEH